MIECGRPDWEELFYIFQERGISPEDFLSSEYFVDILSEICREKYPYTAFSDYFHTVRSMLLPLLRVMCTDVPRADVYHTIATGYAGVLARLGSAMYHVPFLLTEHGIYTREREEEIIRANWVLPAFKDLWIRFFYMLSSAAYSGATMVTSLFARASLTQIEIGADPAACRTVANGIHYDRFAGIQPRESDGPVQIGAILRIAPIKDVKTMLYAFAEVEQHIPGVKLFIAGPEDDPEYALECRQLQRQLGIRGAVFMGTINVLEYMGILILRSSPVFPRASRSPFWNPLPAGRSLCDDGCRLLQGTDLRRGRGQVRTGGILRASHAAARPGPGHGGSVPQPGKTSADGTGGQRTGKKIFPP